jgi:WbqC-like protein family
VARPVSTKRIAIVQSSYIPWKGYFDLIHVVDEFVLFDDVQFTRRDWRNRNRIKTRSGSAWLTIPVEAKGQYLAPIKDIRVSEPGWAERHWKTIRANYARAPFFATYANRLERVFADCVDTRLSAINARWIHEICSILGIETKITWSMDYTVVDGRTERLVSLCQQAGAAVYISGPSARAYLEPARFDAAGIELVYFDYSGYPEYSQLFPPFDHFVSVLDLILNEGPGATRYMLSF